MSFKDKLNKLFDSLIDKKLPPNTSQDYLFFDYIEFYAFFYGEEVSKNEILDYLNDCGINVLKFIGEDEGDSIDENDNKKENAISIIFSCLEYRASLLKENYPYDITTSSITLKPTLSIGNKTYIVLLFCSMLDKFSEFQHDLTSEFELIVYSVLEKMFPNSIIKSFGKNSHYTGSAQNKIEKLARDLNIPTRKHEIQKIKGNQEKGLDLIVWQPFKDRVPNMSISFVQCACGKQWASKLDDAKNYKAYFDCYQSIINYIFASSYALICDDIFSKSDEIVKSGSIYLDRLRIINLLDGSNVSEKAKISFQLVDKLIPYKLVYCSLQLVIE